MITAATEVDTEAMGITLIASLALVIKHQVIKHIYRDYGNYVDPYVVLAALGFGVFLFNLIYNLLNRSARSIEVSDMNLVITQLINCGCP